MVERHVQKTRVGILGARRAALVVAQPMVVVQQAPIVVQPPPVMVQSALLVAAPVRARAGLFGRHRERHVEKTKLRARGSSAAVSSQLQVQGAIQQGAIQQQQIRPQQLPLTAPPQQFIPRQ